MKRIINKVKHRLSRMLLMASSKMSKAKVSCTLCGWSGPYFLNTGWHDNVLCPNCNSQVRQRLFWATIYQLDGYSFDKLFKGKKVLHFAPEPSIYRNLKGSFSDYKTADLLCEDISYQKIDYEIDISDMAPIDDDSIDCLLAFDILEHVYDDKKAMMEIKRVIKSSGVAFLMVPQDETLSKTIEDPSVTDRNERIRLFGAPDHVRIYGDDFIDRLQNCGFKVDVIDENNFDPDVVAREVLKPPVLSDKKFATNYRKLYVARKD